MPKQIRSNHDMNLIKKAGNYLRFGLNIFFLLTLTVLLFSSCSNLLDKNESYNIGFKDGYLKGYSEAILKKKRKLQSRQNQRKLLLNLLINYLETPNR
jgi:hypothetical protein